MKALFTAVRVNYYDFQILVLNFFDLVLVCAVFGSIEDQGEVFVTVEDEGAFADDHNKQGDALPGLEMVEEDPLKLTPISRRFSEESGYQSKSEAATEFE